ncbi:MAG: YHYH domain-containing protein [Clostridia bacterium]|nr:YHYH domain-containing protein [Clostridia bacterium]
MKKTVLLFIIFVTFVSISFAHPGRTDSNGGHYDRSTGEYHYHNDGYVKETTIDNDVGGALKINDSDVNYLQKEIDNKQSTINSLQEQVYSKQNTISKLNYTITEKNEEIEKMKTTQEFMWIGFIIVFLFGICVSYNIGKNKASE